MSCKIVEGQIIDLVLLNLLVTTDFSASNFADEKHDFTDARDPVSLLADSLKHIWKQSLFSTPVHAHWFGEFLVNGSMLFEIFYGDPDHVGSVLLVSPAV